MPDFKRILPLNQRPAPRPGEMVLAPQLRAPVQIDTRGQNAPVLADGRAFAASDLARADMGRAVEGIGGYFKDLALHQMNAVNIRKVADAQGYMDTAESEMVAKMAEEKDELKWKGIAADHIAKVRDKIYGLNLSPVAKEKITSDLSRWEIHRTGQVLEQSALHSDARAKAALGKKLEVATLKQDRPALESNLRGGVESGLLHPEDSQIAILKYEETGKRLQKIARAEAFDNGLNAAVQTASDAGEDEALKGLQSGMFGKLDAADAERIRNSIQAAARDRAGSALNDLAEGIVTGKITSPAAIDALENVHLSPLIRQRAKDQLQGFNAEKAAQDRAINGVKNAVELRQSVKTYDPATDPSREKFFTLNREIRARVDEVNQGELTQTLFQKYGTKPPKLELRPEIQRNVSASLDVMFDPASGAVPWRRTEDDAATGKQKIIEDAAARQQAINAQTVVEMGMSAWYKDHPEDAQNLSKVQAKLQSLLPEGTRASALGTLNQLMRPAAPPAAAEPPNLGAQGATGPQGTAFIPAPAASRITSYAYSNDSTPDSNSSAGIGAFVPDDEAAKIKAGEPSPYKLRDGDFAVSGDVEKNLRDAGIEPGDEVTVQLADGSTQTGRWMDRTADTWEGETVTGRFDFYRGGKSTKHPKEATKVTGFKKIRPATN